jgi:hypothetical protein
LGIVSSSNQKGKQIDAAHVVKKDFLKKWHGLDVKKTKSLDPLHGSVPANALARLRAFSVSLAHSGAR